MNGSQDPPPERGRLVGRASWIRSRWPPQAGLGTTAGVRAPGRRGTAASGCRHSADTLPWLRPCACPSLPTTRPPHPKRQRSRIRTTGLLTRLRPIKLCCSVAHASGGHDLTRAAARHARWTTPLLGLGDHYPADAMGDPVAQIGRLGCPRQASGAAWRRYWPEGFSVPFKTNADRHHHVPKQRHRVTNSALYDAVLRQRGSPTVWFTEAAILAWRAEPRTMQGGQPRHSVLGHCHRADAAGDVPAGAATDRRADRLCHHPARPRSRGARSPTLSRQAKTLEVARSRLGSAPMHLLVDSTGLKLCGSGEWLLE